MAHLEADCNQATSVKEAHLDHLCLCLRLRLRLLLQGKLAECILFVQEMLVQGIREVFRYRTR